MEDQMQRFSANYDAEEEREIWRLTLGTTTGFLKFFQPTLQFIKWVKRVAGKQQVYDVGAGAGHVTKALLEAGIATVALDVHRHMQPEHPVLIADGSAFDYEKGSIVMLCRPNHGPLATDVIGRALECGASNVLYVGLERNAEADLGEYLPRFKKAVPHAGEEGEWVWVLDNALNHRVPA
jgi:hypothetical protein